MREHFSVPYASLARTKSLSRVARAIIPRATTLDFFSRCIFLEYTPPDTQGGGGRAGRAGQGTAGWLAASAAAARGSVSVSLFAFCLPAEHRGVQESRGAIERRRLIAVERRAENRAPCYDSPLRARLHLAPVLPSLRATIRKGVKSEWNYLCARTWF